MEYYLITAWSKSLCGFLKLIALVMQIYFLIYLPSSDGNHFQVGFVSLVDDNIVLS